MFGMEKQPKSKYVRVAEATPMTKQITVYLHTGTGGTCSRNRRHLSILWVRWYDDRR